jgi:hypothetical protein
VGVGGQGAARASVAGELPRCWIYGQQQQLRRLFQFRRRGASSQHGGWAQQQSLPAAARGCWGIWHQLLEVAGKRPLGVACWLLPIAYCMQLAGRHVGSAAARASAGEVTFALKLTVATCVVPLTKSTH